MSKEPKITRWQQARRYLVDRRRIKEIKISRLKWNLQKILDKSGEG